MINNKRLLETFLEYVKIDSESKSELAMAHKLISDLQEIGCETYIDNTSESTGSETGNLFCILKGDLPGTAPLLSAHMDTVVPGKGVNPIIEDGVIKTDGKTVLGGDDKSGVAAIVEVLRTVVENELPHPTIQAVFPVCEEIGLLGSKFMEYERIIPDRAVVLDSGGDAGKIITSAPGQYKIKAAVVGKRAHAGVAPETGISAIQVLSEAISNMKLLRIDEETTANIGTVKSEYATNIVAERAEIFAEARSRNDEKLEKQAQHMLNCLNNACEKYGAKLEGGLTKTYSAYCYGPEDEFVLEVEDAVRKAGLKPILASSGGGSDANNMNLHGIKALVLGTGMTKVHTVEETLTVKNLEDTARLTLSLITR